jgi:hypothetical protein
MSIVEDLQVKKRAIDKAKRGATEHQIQTLIDGKYEYVDAGEIQINGKSFNQFISSNENHKKGMDIKQNTIDKKLVNTMETFNEAVSVMKLYVDKTNSLQNDWNTKERLELERKQKLEFNILGYVRGGA